MNCPPKPTGGRTLVKCHWPTVIDNSWMVREMKFTSSGFQKKLRFLVSVNLISVSVVFVGLTSTQAADSLEQQARSLLSNRCFACHGPDDAQREAGLRLDQADAYSKPTDSGKLPVVVGKPQESEILLKILAESDDERMPPPKFAARLTKAEIEIIEKWIQSGAKFPQHWSFVPPVRPALPKVDAKLSKHEQEWLSHPVDRFVLAEQLERGLRPSVPATRAELLRRLSLDLIGLPPTPEQVHRFEQDTSPDAHEREVDRLLSSTAYGEHWARKWLDLARYADSAGYADDPARTIWAYRDWVIDALNEDMPLDQFTLEQLAGDLLPNPTESQLVATAFHRNTLTNNEGGTNDEEFRNVAIVDRVNTTMAVWMGLTFSCAQCHNHKYDPFSQEEYFRIFAILNQSQDADRRDESPTLELYSANQQRDRQLWQKQIQQLEQQLELITPEVQAELQAWEEQLREPAWKTQVATSAQDNSKSDFELSADGPILVKPTGNNIVTDTYTINFPLDASEQPLTAVAIRTLPHASLPGGGAGLSGGNFVVTGVSARLIAMSEGAPALPAARFIRVELPGKDRILSLAEVETYVDGKNVAASGKATQSSTDYGGDAPRAIDGKTDGDYEKNSTTHTASSQDPWWELDLGSVQSIEKIAIWNRTGEVYQRLNGAIVKLLDADRKQVSQETIAEAPKQHQDLVFQESTPVTFTEAFADYEQKDFPPAAVVDRDKATGWAVGGKVDQPHVLTLIPAKPIELKQPVLLRLQIEHNSTHRHHLLGSFEVAMTGSPNARDWAMLPSDLLAVHAIARPQRTPQQAESLAHFFASRLAKIHDDRRKELSGLREKLAGLKPETSVPIMRELEKNPRETFVQLRGNYKSLGKKVEPGTPQMFAPATVNSNGPNRLDLARWLVSRQNPLTARVWVNRVWESLFGLGIVRTSEEFGSQGDPPTHPELLDWLACEYMDLGWDNKRLLKLLVTSETYRQTSQVTPDALAKDNENLWLARGARVRLSAEMVRDQSLAISGLLSQKMYGMPVRPPQPNMGLKAAFGSDTDWQTSAGEDRYRRGVYTTWRRSNPYPSMATFDAPSREVCTLRRDSTNTPLQALVTLNDPAFVEAAQAFARRVVLGSGVEGPTDQMKLAFELCVSRQVTDAELKPLLKLLEQARTQLAGETEAANSLATDPIGPLPKGADAIELAAWTAVCNVLLNLDEVLMKR